MEKSENMSVVDQLCSQKSVSTEVRKKYSAISDYP